MLSNCVVVVGALRLKKHDEGPRKETTRDLTNSTCVNEGVSEYKT